MRKRLYFLSTFIGILLIAGCAKKPLPEEKEPPAKQKEEAIISSQDWIYSIAINPANSKIVYAATPSGIYVSVNGGKFWCEATEGLTNLNIATIVIHPQNPDIVYAGGDGGVFKSIGRDTVWKEINHGLTNPLVKVLAIDPNNPEIIYAGCIGDGGLFKSCDGGELWLRIRKNLPINIQITAIAITKDSQVYIAGWQQGIFRSNDGEKWERMNNGLESLLVRSIAINPIRPEIIYAGTQDGLFGSTNKGEKWKKLTKPPASPMVWTIVINPLETNIVYLGAWLSGISCSPNFGEYWEKRNQGLLNTCVHYLVMDPTNPDILYAGTEEGVYKSLDAGLTWMPCGGFGKIEPSESEGEFIEEHK
ncbi:hypothetical protein HY792_07200 [Candidatus Desantisbacteria bacterium]|nr:hypothetical protein [Candidatus Desantisbacteria bacterium]